MKVFHDFHARDKFEKNLNATFNALIPGKKKKRLLISGIFDLSVRWVEFIKLSSKFLPPTG